MRSAPRKPRSRVNIANGTGAPLCFDGTTLTPPGPGSCGGGGAGNGSPCTTGSACGSGILRRRRVLQLGLHRRLPGVHGGQEGHRLERHLRTDRRRERSGLGMRRPGRRIRAARTASATARGLAASTPPARCAERRLARAERSPARLATAPAPVSRARAAAASTCARARAACGNTCTSDANCVASAYCRASDSTCQPDQGNGGACTAASQCTVGQLRRRLLLRLVVHGRVPGVFGRQERARAATAPAATSAAEATPTTNVPTTARCPAIATAPATAAAPAGCTRPALRAAPTPALPAVQSGQSCDGFGACNPSNVTQCTPYVCASASACGTTCTRDTRLHRVGLV